MDILTYIGLTILGMIVSYIAWNERDKRQMRQRMSSFITEEYMYIMHERMSAPDRVRMKNIEEDIIRIENGQLRMEDKLDRILEIMAQLK